MNSASVSNGRAPSQQPSHPLPSVEPQQSAWSLDYQNTLYPNFTDTRFDDPRRSVMLPNSDSLLTSHSQLPRDLDENVDPSSSLLPVTTAGSGQSQNFCASGLAQCYVPADPLPRARSSPVTDATSLRQPTYPPFCTCIAHPTIPSAGPSWLGGEQPTFLSWNDHMTQPGPVTAAREVTLAQPPSPSQPLQPFNTDPGIFHPPPTAPAAQAQAQNFPNVDVTEWHQSRGGRASTRVPPCPRGPRTRPRPPLVRVEDQVVWVRPHVLKVTMWLNWSSNADTEAREPWD